MKSEEIFFLVSDALEIRLIPRNPITICEIRYMGNLVSYGISRCKHGKLIHSTEHIAVYVNGDKYDKVKGLRQALMSALNNSSITNEKEERRKIWNKFFELYPYKKERFKNDNHHN